jgi:hypothetical protein
MSSLPEPGRPADDAPPKVRLMKGQEVSLGCGTLILIALIVLIFGRAGTGDLERELRGLRSEVSELKLAVEAQTRQIRALQDKLDKAKAKE